MLLGLGHLTKGLGKTSWKSLAKGNSAMCPPYRLLYEALRQWCVPHVFLHNRARAFAWLKGLHYLCIHVRVPPVGPLSLLRVLQCHCLVTAWDALPCLPRVTCLLPIIPSAQKTPFSASTLCIPCLCPCICIASVQGHPLSGHCLWLN